MYSFTEARLPELWALISSPGKAASWRCAAGRPGCIFTNATGGSDFSSPRQWTRGWEDDLH